MRLSCFAIISFATTAVSATHYYRGIPHKVKESVLGPPHGWVRSNPPPSNHLLELKIALPQPHFPNLEQHLWEVSDPDHERYGAHLSKEETDALMAPRPEALDAVSAWLSSYGIKKEHLRASSAKDWVFVRVPVALAEEMLDTKYYVYTHSDSGESVVRTTSYSLPEDLHEHIELILPTTMFSRIKPVKRTLYWTNKRRFESDPSNGTFTGPAGNQIDASCKKLITITCLRQLYNAVGYNTSANNSNKIAVTSYSENYANNEDLQQFYQLQNPAALGSNYTFVSINGGLNNQSSDAASEEGNMNTQFAFGLTHPTPAIFYSTGGSPPFIPDTLSPENDNEPYLDWLKYMLFQDDLPQTISTSFADDEQTVPFFYAARVCAEFAALGIRGVSVLFGAGNGGVGDNDPNPATQKCWSNDGKNKTVFLPQFPASCPYVTAVGGTTHFPEIAVNYSAGGFSNYFSRPPYQKAAVNKYLQNLAPGTYDGLYNSMGRAFPDVAAYADDYEIVYKGQLYRYWGTSTAVPTFSSLISMLNDALITMGKSPLGFLNTWLYLRGHIGLNDITQANNPGCGTSGFNATTGWDPLTGLGTPNFQKLLALVGNH